MITARIIASQYRSLTLGFACLISFTVHQAQGGIITVTYPESADGDIELDIGS